MDILFVPMLLLIKAIIDIAIIVVVAGVLMSWLITANVFNSNNHIVFSIIDTLAKLSELMLRPIRKFIPTNIGMLDISPVVLILLLTFFENVINRILAKL